MNILEAKQLIKRVESDLEAPPSVRRLAVIREGSHVPDCRGSTGFCVGCIMRDRDIIAARVAIESFYRDRQQIALVA